MQQQTIIVIIIDKPMIDPITIKTIATMDNAAPINELTKSSKSEYEAWTSRLPDRDFTE